MLVRILLNCSYNIVYVGYSGNAGYSTIVKELYRIISITRDAANIRIMSDTISCSLFWCDN